MPILTLQEVTATNWRATLRLRVHAEQQRFVADYTPVAAITLAKAYVRPGGLVWVPYAIYADQQIVGLLALAYTPASQHDYWVYHFFIDATQQGQGYGRQALHALVDLLRAQHPRCHLLQLTVHPDNVRAQRLYRSVGFRPTGSERDGEPTYQLSIR